MSRTVVVKSDEAKALHLSLGEAIDMIETLEASLKEAKMVRAEASARYWRLVNEAVEVGGTVHFEIIDDGDVVE